MAGIETHICIYQTAMDLLNRKSERIPRCLRRG
ncbi:MAG: hypothetical protein H8E80_05105 [Desulfobacteraceae bacterium]|uniref:Isochorismatase family protein n=1 Tax=Candidatus Desulfaltia bathyphila TaxID=2841697 RepID=A0A8J6TBQ7_9BACT|nr:hypothetical protein [Candidatus Desulfaltia bathyphila]MBL7195692.1 hypothetical protein [Desulfobacterales bacterium]